MKPARKPFIAAIFLAITSTLGPLRAAEEAPDRMDWWREARFGMFIHWGLYSVAGGEWKGQRNDQIASWLQHELRIPPDDYAKLITGFTAENYKPDEWAALAKRAGMKYAVFTSKHHEGFSLFDSKLSDFDVMNSPAKRDVTREFLDAFRDAGLKAGLYFSVIDWHHPDYPVAGDSLHPMRDDPAYQNQPRDLGKYLDLMHGQVRELVTGYGPLDVMWWDFSYGRMQGETWRADDLVAMVREHHPKIIMNNRLYEGQNNPSGDFATPEQHIPANGLPGLDWETCMTINDTWGYKPFDLNFKDSITLIRNLVDIVSKGGNYLLNVGPRPDGSIPQPLVERLEAVGKWMEVNGDSIYGTTASPFDKQLPWGRVTVKQVDGGTSRLFLHVFDWPISREIVLPPLENAIRNVKLLDGGDALETRDSPLGTVIRLPHHPRHEAATVLVVEIDGPPVATVETLGPDDVGVYHLTAGTARLNGSGLIYPSGGGEDSIGHWANSGDWVSWMLDVPEAGTYRVELTYGCEEGSGGTYRIGVADRELVGDASPTGGWFERRTESPGTLELPAGRPLEFFVKVDDLKGMAIMDLKKVELKPQAKATQ